MDAQTAHDLAALYSEATVREACRRLRERRPPPVHPMGWLKRALKSLHVSATELAQPTAEERQAKAMGERLAAQQQTDAERTRALKGRWQALSAERQAELLAAARAGQPVLRGRADGHPLVLAAAMNLMAEQEAAEGLCGGG